MLLCLAWAMLIAGWLAMMGGAWMVALPLFGAAVALFCVEAWWR